MYDTAKCVELVKLRVRELRRKQAKKCICKLSVLCVVLLASFVWTVGVLTEQVGLTDIRGMCGTMLLHEDAGGYVVVGVVTFVAAVVITILCVRYSEKVKKNRCRDKEKEDSHQN